MYATIIDTLKEGDIEKAIRICRQALHKNRNRITKYREKQQQKINK
ncbi:hypothetical protein [Chondrinema litorale]|nr:hypothetical protein [Chondrinema litorale]UZR95962.1 hypothetical protein OQ292_09065 [Chondrinema litorale]